MNDDGPRSKNEGSDEHEPLGSESRAQETEARGEDMTLTCVQCGAQFVFTVEEQAFFAERNFHSPPKRCKSCRAERRRSRRKGRGRGGLKEYRAPAFRDGERKGRGIYRSPAFRERDQADGVYRAPAFRDQAEAADDIYRSPAFREVEQDPDEIYRAPAFQPAPYEVEEEPPPPQEVGPEEVDLEAGPPPGYREPRSPHEIYRSPAFSDTDPANYAPSYRRRQMHDIVCADCGRKAKVPFKPKPGRPVYCKECYPKHK